MTIMATIWNITAVNAGLLFGQPNLKMKPKHTLKITMMVGQIAIIMNRQHQSLAGMDEKNQRCFWQR
jgi:putative Mn2+ efflux pump MntP